jgi:biopolymer transport protein ExbB
MISKKLAIAAAIVLLSAASVGQALAQASSQPAMATPGAAAPAMAPATGTPGAPGAATTPGAPAAAATPAPTPPVITPPASTAPKASPYGIGPLWYEGDLVIKSVVVILGIMSIGTWYIFVMKYWEQSRVISQARIVERRFWSSSNLNEGIDKLPKNSLFRSLAESGVRAASGQGTGLVNLNDWISMSLNRQLEEANARMQGGIAFLASVGSTAPFVGLLGTVWGILNALIAIGVAGQVSIDKVAGPVGQALIATALGLLVAVPGVLLYNYLVRRNKVINEKLRSFAADLQTYLVTNKK